MQRKLLSGMLAVVLTILGMTSVATAQNPIIAPTNCDNPGALKLRVWDETWAGILEESIAHWESTYCPGATVEVEVLAWGDYWSTLEENAEFGGMPDVFNMSQTFFYNYANANALLNLQPYWDTYGVDTAIWGTGLVNPYRWGENSDLYAGPVNWDTVAVYYNQDLFDAAGLEHPNDFWTWDDFEDAATALTDPEAGVYGAAVYPEYQTGYANWIAATGESPIVDPERTQCTLTSEESLDALTFLTDLYNAGAMPSIEEMGGPTADAAFEFWTAGRVAMITDGSWKLPDAFENATFNWDVVQLPRHPDTERTRSILHSVGYVAASTTENPDLAANLILFLVSDEGQQFFADAGGVAPANPSPEIQQTWVGSFESDKNIFAFVAATVDSQGVTAYGEIWDEINTELVLRIFDDGVPIEEAVATTCAFIETQLPE